MRKWLLLVFLVGCGSETDVTGTWRYDWHLRDELNTGVEGWDGHFRGVLELHQENGQVTGALGYPDEDPAAFYNDPRLRELWTWTVSGPVDGNVVHLHAPPPLTAWDDPWWFDVTVDEPSMSGPTYAGNRRVPQPYPFRAVRQ